MIGSVLVSVVGEKGDSFGLCFFNKEVLKIYLFCLEIEVVGVMYFFPCVFAELLDNTVKFGDDLAPLSLGISHGHGG